MCEQQTCVGYWSVRVISCCLPDCSMFLFDHFINSFVTIFSLWSYSWLCSESFSFSFSSSLSPQLSLPSRVHPSVHPSGRGEERQAERGAGWSKGWSDSWSPIRQGETNYPSNENHSSWLHLSSLPSSTPPSEIQRTWMATPGKKKRKILTLFLVLFPFSRNSCCSGYQHALLLRCGKIMKRKRRKKQQDKGNVEWLNEKHIRRRRRKKTLTHPCWHMWRLITMAAVSTDVELRGSCQSVRVCVCVSASDSNLRAI